MDSGSQRIFRFCTYLFGKIVCMGLFFVIYIQNRYSCVLGIQIVQFDFHDLDTWNTCLFCVINLILSDIQICSEFQHKP